jgi:flagellar biosynthesis/type III secretory pathway protein FliH
MSLSNNIRSSHTAQLEIQPFRLLETDDEALYRSAAPSAVIPRHEQAALVHTFMLSETTFAQEDEERTPPPAAEGPGPVLHQDTGMVTITADSAAEAPPPAPHLDPALVLQQAQAEAERCIAEAQAQAAMLHTQGYDEGLRRGEEAGKRAAAEQYSTLLASFLLSTEAVIRLREDILRLAEEDIVTLAFHLARKIIRHEVRSPRDTLTATLRQALAYVVDRDQVTVRVNPEDLQLASTLQQELRQTIEGLRGLTFEGDATIGRGGCVVTSAFGEIDARLEAQLEELERRFHAHSLPVSEESSI